MDPISAIIAILLVLMAIQIYKNVVSDIKGPFALPFVGNMLQIDQHVHYTLTMWRGVFGDIYKITLGNCQFIVLNGYDVIKDALVKHADYFYLRPPDYYFQVLQDSKGIVYANAKEWKEQRSFALHALREFGMGKRSLEEKIKEECLNLEEEVENWNGNPQGEISLVMAKATSNIISLVLFGRRWSYDSDHLTKRVAAVGACLEVNPILQYFTGARYIPGDLFGFGKIKKEYDFLSNFYREQIEDHKQNFDENNIEDFIDAYLLEQKKRSENPNTSFDDRTMLEVASDLFIAGTHTTSVTLSWALLLMIRFPEIQSKVRKEILDVIGPDKMPSLKDKLHLPYTEATIYEISRFSTIAPIGLGNMVADDIEFHGVKLKKGTEIMVNFWSIHRDENEFPEPNKFKPERFLDSNGKVANTEKLATFAYGRRSCLGEPIAKVELFVFFTRLIQKFEFSKPPADPRLKIGGLMTFVHEPKPYRLIANKL